MTFQFQYHINILWSVDYLNFASVICTNLVSCGTINTFDQYNLSWYNMFYDYFTMLMHWSVSLFMHHDLYLSHPKSEGSNMHLMIWWVLHYFLYTFLRLWFFKTIHLVYGVLVVLHVLFLLFQIFWKSTSRFQAGLVKISMLDLWLLIYQEISHFSN